MKNKQHYSFKVIAFLLLLLFLLLTFTRYTSFCSISPNNKTNIEGSNREIFFKSSLFFKLKLFKQNIFFQKLSNRVV